MPNMAYRIMVTSPCPGEQLVTKVAPTHYVGSPGDFTFATMTRGPQDAQWDILVYDYERAGDCTPSKLFVQVVPNADDPTGEYTCADGTGSARVFDFP